LKKYECLYIVNTNFDSEGTSTVVARVEEILKNVGAEVANTQHWGKRKLAYAVDKERYGNYILLHFQGEDPQLEDFHREIEIEKGVLHYMTIRLDDFPDFETLAVPQAYETDRRKPAYSGGRKPRQYGDDDRSSRKPYEGRSEKAAPAEEAPAKPETTDTPAPAEAVSAPEAEKAPAAVVKEDADKPADAE